MEIRKIGRSKLKVGALGLGTMNFGSDWMGSGALSEKRARRLVDAAAERGVTLIDTADIYGYGASERMLGKILKGRRPSFVLATKVLGEMRPGDPASGGLSGKHIREGLDASLRRLRTDYVDLYMPHGPDPRVPLEETLEALEKARACGKIRVLGCSNFCAPEWRTCLGWAKTHKRSRFEFDQIQLSLAAPYAERELSPVVRTEGTSVLSWSPLAGGFLTGKYSPGKPRKGRRKDPSDAFPPVNEARLAGLTQLLSRVAELEGVTPAQAALGWLLSKKWVASSIVGARTEAQLTELLASRKLSKRSANLLNRAASAITAAG